MDILLIALVGLASISCVPPEESTPQPRGVRIEPAGEGFRLTRGGEPFRIRGACGLSHLDRLAASGANAVRIWDLGRDGERLDEAERLGLAVLVGLPLGKPRQGFDYGDQAAIARQRERIRAIVERWRAHPAVLMWAIGNEPTIFTPPAQRVTLWKEVETLARLVHDLDPDHPVIAIVGAEQWKQHMRELEEHCPSLDAVGLNAYADMMTLPEDLARQGWKRPWLVTEFGPRGHWQSPRTAWGARIEPSSTEKAEHYRRAYEHAVQDQPRCLGSFAFLWGWKMEKTHTWYGMLLADGSRTAAADVMTQIWSGQAPADLCPALGPESVTLSAEDGGVPDRAQVFRPASTLRVAVAASDPEGAPLTITWDLRRDVSEDPSVGGDFQPLEPEIAGAVLATDGSRARIRLPAEPGKYRVFVTVRDPAGNAATANVPLLVAE